VSDGWCDVEKGKEEWNEQEQQKHDTLKKKRMIGSK
jgi:hypothetical protein